MVVTKKPEDLPLSPVQNDEEGMITSISDQLAAFSTPTEESPPLETSAVPQEETAARARAKPVPAPPTLPKKAGPAPLRLFSAPPAPFRVRFLRALVISALVLLGSLLGLGAMGVKPVPKDLFLLFQYGKRPLSKEVQVLNYRGVIQEASPTERILQVAGEILNNSDQDAPAPTLRLEVFSQNGEWLMKKAFPCCPERLVAGSITPFSTQIDLGQVSSIGAYKVSIEK